VTGTRVFRPGATIVPLFFWALMTGTAAVYSLQVGMIRPPGSEARWAAFSIALTGFVFGPLAFVVYFLRLWLVTVSIVPRRGLILSGRRTIPWMEIRSIELVEAAFKGLLRANPLIFLYTAGCFALLYYVVLPACALFTSWHRRVILRLSDGEALVLRDLMNAEEFVEEASRHIRPPRADSGGDVS